MSSGRSLFGIAIAAVTLMFCGFLGGVVDLLDASAGMRMFWQVVFALSAITTLGTAALAIVNLVKRRNEVVSVATLLVPVIPVALIVGMVGIG